MGPMPPVSELLQYMNKALWYCSLDMASKLWVVKMTKWVRKISAFITPSCLYMWLRILFGLKSAPQLYQRLIENALYGYLIIGDNTDSTATDLPILNDVFTEGEPDTDRSPSKLCHRSEIDHMLILATTCISLYDKVEKLLAVCDR